MINIFLIFLYLVWPNSSYANSKNICDRIQLMDGQLELNSNEKVLVCGSSEKGWNDIPTAQSIALIKNIALNAGYNNPRFETNENKIKIWLGERTLVSSLRVNGSKNILNPRKKRKAVGEPLVKKTLDDIESWANLKIGSNGYACAKVKVQAQAWDGQVMVNSDLGPKTYFGEVRPDEFEGLDPDILKRYQPFEIGDSYDVRKTQIMISRILSDGLIQSAYFTTECEGNTVKLQLHTSVAKPHILRFGVGASTEEFPFVDISYRDTKLDDQASSYLINLHISPRIISASVNSTLHKFLNSKKTYLGPRFVVSRESEDSYSVYNSKIGIDVGKKWDQWGIRWEAKIGPTYNYTNTIRGIGPHDETYPSLDAVVGLMSHNYEFSLADQYEGWISQIRYSGRSDELESETNLSRYQFSIKHLWNILDYSPPLFVLGTRLESTVVDVSVPNTASRATAIPTDDKVYLGGDDNLRGFSRKSLNNNGLGYLTSVYLGFELRLVEELPFKLQPFLLYDMAKLGNENYKLDEALYTSTGIGIRWASPIGTLRASFAKGDIIDEVPGSNYKKEWVTFFSFGQEF